MSFCLTFNILSAGVWMATSRTRHLHWEAGCMCCPAPTPHLFSFHEVLLPHDPGWPISIFYPPPPPLTTVTGIVKVLSGPWKSQIKKSKPIENVVGTEVARGREHSTTQDNVWALHGWAWAFRSTGQTVPFAAGTCWSFFLHSATDSLVYRWYIKI